MGDTTARNTHELKTVPPYFDAVARGDKPFEIRKNDRGYRVGDTLRLREWDGERYTGREVTADVTYVTDFQQHPGYVVLGIRRRDTTESDAGEDAFVDSDPYLAFIDKANTAIHKHLVSCFGDVDFGDVPMETLNAVLTILPEHVFAAPPDEDAVGEG